MENNNQELPTKEEQQALLVLETVINTYLLIEQIDALEDCKAVFNGVLKNKAKLFLRALTPIADKALGKALEVDEESTQALLDHRRKLIKKYATFNKDELNDLAAMHDEIFRKRKEREELIKKHTPKIQPYVEQTK